MSNKKHKKSLLKRSIAIMVTLILTLSMMPTTALAGGHFYTDLEATITAIVVESSDSEEKPAQEKGDKAAAAAPIEVDKARIWVDAKGRELINVFAEENTLEKYKQLDDLFLNYVDLEHIGQFVAGKYWRTMTPERSHSRN